MLRRFLLILAGALLITLAVSAVGLAETYSFGDVRASVSVPDDFEMVLTPYNLGSSRDWLEQHGLDQYERDQQKCGRKDRVVRYCDR